VNAITLDVDMANYNGQMYGIDGLMNLAQMQDERGAAYIDVNVGPRSPEFLADIVKQVQAVTAKPLSIDTPDPAMAEAALKAYDLERAGGITPVLNSISPLRMEMFDLFSIMPFKPLLLVSERMQNGADQANHTAEETYETALELVAAAKSKGIAVNDMIIDPGIAPLGTDSEGNIHRLMSSIKLMHENADLAGVHKSVGLSNFTVMLPPKRPDGSPVKGALESAFLTRAMPLGMDHIIGSVKRKYRILEESDDAMVCFDECLKLEGFDVIMRVQDFYNS